MKRHAFITVAVVLLISALSLAGIRVIRSVQRDAQFKAIQTGFTMILQLQASALNDGYFSWTEVRDLVEKNALSDAQSHLEDIYGIYPFIEDVAIRPGDPPEDSYEIAGSNASLRLTFGLKDDFGENPLPGWVGIATISAQELLDSLQSRTKLVIDPEKGRELAYSIMVDFKVPLVTWLDHLLVISFTMVAGYSVSLWLWRKNIYYYETRGLESIIFLFEQTEKISANHSRRVAVLTLFLGEKMDYKGRRLRNLYTAALLHDIGKISLPSNILLKEGPLTSQEQRAMAAHPIISARILTNFKELAHLSSIVLHHHERMDGSGYPEGLLGKDIPEESRIIAVVDVFEALVGERPYRVPMEQEEAFATLRTMSLDQSIVETLARNYRGFQKFKAPAWAIAYPHSLETI